MDVEGYRLPRGAVARLPSVGRGRRQSRPGALVSDGSLLLLTVEIAAMAIGLLLLLPREILQDTWLALVAGREVAQGGIPHHEMLTVYAHSKTWIDQQWLSQLITYELQRVVGVVGIALVSVTLITVSVSAAVSAARRLGATPSSVVLVLPLAVIGILASSEVRTQMSAYPLFVGVVYLLATDSRRPSRRVYWCLPLLVLWANLHGSATMGAGLVGLRGLTEAWERRRLLASTPRAWLRPAVLILAPAACLIATPYGTSIVSYYHATLLNPAFSKLVTEWQPVTAVPLLAVMFFVLAAVTVWSFGAHRGMTTLWERLAVLVLAAGAIMAVRNVVWFDLLAVIVLPVSINAAVQGRAKNRPPRTQPAINLMLVGASTFALLMFLSITPSRINTALASSYPDRLAAIASAQARVDPSLRVFADERFADWLLWRDPGLAGRVAYDASFELLSADQLSSIFMFKNEVGPAWDTAARGYRLLVLNPSSPAATIDASQRARGSRILYRAQRVTVILRGRAA